MLFMRKRTAIVLSILAVLAGGVVAGLNSADTDPTVESRPNAGRTITFRSA
jgi:hypothetical protein